MELDAGKPSTRTRAFFWVILGSFSVYFAEVVSGSDIFPFFKPLSWVLVFPLYALHTLVLWTAVFRNGRGWLYALFPAGALFGLYEAYITKVIWSPTWNAAPYRLGGVAVVETLLLVLFWHAFMAFIVPLFLAETALTSSREVFGLLPGPAKMMLASKRGPMLACALAFVAGIFQSTGAPTPFDSLASGILNSTFLIVLISVWKRRGGTRHRFRDLLPGPKGFKFLLALLGADYVILGALLRPEETPGIGAQATVWALYVFFGLLLYLGVRRSMVLKGGSSAPYEIDTSARRLVVLTVLFTAGSVLGSLTGLGFIAALSVWVAGIAFGLVVLGLTVRHVCSDRTGILGLDEA
jgi:hypothetical protein